MARAMSTAQRTQGVKPPATFAPLRYGHGTWSVICGGTRRIVCYPFIEGREARRTIAHRTLMTIGDRVKRLALHGFNRGEVLAAAERAEVVAFTLGFEECYRFRSELEAMTDEGLVHAAYRVMLDYARGQA